MMRPGSISAGRISERAPIMQNGDPDRPKVAAFPPFILASALALGCLMDFLLPVRFSPRPYSLPFGLFFVVCAISFAALAIREMSRANTAVDVRKPASTLVTSGVFKVSRNPIYLGMVLLCLGVAFLLNSLWVMLAAAPLAIALQKGVIEPEETYLEQTFGGAYRQYKANVRRWL
jgi:protein-S-isoprenylcysteine O-methyltransferase Ste14